MPKHPRGYYRSLWQLQDAAGCRRRYPAFTMACGPFISREDCWSPGEWNRLCVAVNNGANPWQHTAFQDALSHTLAVAAPGLATFWPYPHVDGQAYGWLNAYNPAYGPRVEAWMWFADPVFTYVRLRDNAHFLFTDPALPAIPILGYVLNNYGVDVFGNPWTNPL